MLAQLNEQETFWSGSFGNDYNDRNNGFFLPSRIALFTKVLSHCRDIESVLELGANIGVNLDAIRTLMPNVHTAGVEINESAAAIARQKGHHIENTPIKEASIASCYDLTFTVNVLIHVNPDELADAYAKLYHNSSKYILIAEYFNPVPVAIEYRGHSNKLFKRDFAREFMDAHKVELIDYGFVWKHDPHFAMDDTTWFLMRKVD